MYNVLCLPSYKWATSEVFLQSLEVKGGASVARSSLEEHFAKSSNKSLYFGYLEINHHVTTYTKEINNYYNLCPFCFCFSEKENYQYTLK